MKQIIWKIIIVIIVIIISILLYSCSYKKMAAGSGGQSTGEQPKKWSDPKKETNPDLRPGHGAKKDDDEDSF